MRKCLDIYSHNLTLLVGYLSQTEGLSPEFFNEANEALNVDGERMKAMLLDWSQRVETWQKTKLIADRAMGSFVAGKVGA